MFYFHFIVYSAAASHFVLVSAQIFCSDLLAPNKTKYYPMRHCQRSNKTRIAAKNVESLKECEQLAEYNNGLAFNYGHGRKPRKKDDSNNWINLFDTIKKEENYTNRWSGTAKELELSNDPYFNCEVFDCPELGNMSTIINDTRYDYYSIYGRAPANATCLPTTGLFLFYYDDRMNYTEASITCDNHRGRLANVMSLERTNYLSALVAEHASDTNKNSFQLSSSNESPNKIPIHHAFVGLREVKRKGAFFDSNDVPIHCHLFRAWEPSFPFEGKTLGCVAITDSRSWKMFDCRKRMPFVCELKATRPRKNRKFNQQCSLKRPNN